MDATMCVTTNDDDIHREEVNHMDMSTSELYAYRGVYQAYAWQQGYGGHITEFRLPDQYFFIGSDDYNEGFDLLKFFKVVEDMDDEGCIHMWKLDSRKGDTFLMLGCTEDDSLKYIEDPDATGFHHASWYVKNLKA